MIPLSWKDFNIRTRALSVFSATRYPKKCRFPPFVRVRLKRSLWEHSGIPPFWWERRAFPQELPSRTPYELLLVLYHKYSKLSTAYANFRNEISSVFTQFCKIYMIFRKRFRETFSDSLRSACRRPWKYRAFTVANVRKSTEYREKSRMNFVNAWWMYNYRKRPPMHMTSKVFEKTSGRQDLNLRHRAPKARTLPNWATSRNQYIISHHEHSVNIKIWNDAIWFGF